MRTYLVGLPHAVIRDIKKEDGLGQEELYGKS